MSSRNSFASMQMVCLLAVGFLVLEPAGKGASAGQHVSKHREGGRNYVLESRRRSRGARIPLPIGPSYIYYDYPYYYARGYYPRHIGGYVYYPSYYYGRSPYLGPRTRHHLKARRHW